jgi:Na+-translocating ferredoxin:NAD+ oxidoreductase subunit B
MEDNEKIYRDLQQHLDKETIGFPESQSGSAVGLLKQMFTPQQAEVVMFLTYKLQPLATIQERARAMGKSPDETEQLLDQTLARGVIGFKLVDGVKHYKTIPFLIGMLEGSMLAAPPETKPVLDAAVNQFMKDGLFIRDFVNTKIPQMRTIPIQKSITPKHQIGTYDEIRKLIEANTGPIIIMECVCRTGMAKTGQPCKQTARKETCMLLGDFAGEVAKSGKLGRRIDNEEALDILRKNQEEGLVLQPTNAQSPIAICSCCGCCCGLLRIQKVIPNPVSHWATNFFAVVDSELCTGCSACVQRCQVAALNINGSQSMPIVDLTRCLGCGLCVEACPEGAIELKNKTAETVPPPTMDDMMEVIMTNKSS